MAELEEVAENVYTWILIGKSCKTLAKSDETYFDHWQLPDRHDLFPDATCG